VNISRNCGLTGEDQSHDNYHGEDEETCRIEVLEGRPGQCQIHFAVRHGDGFSAHKMMEERTRAAGDGVRRNSAVGLQLRQAGVRCQVFSR